MSLSLGTRNLKFMQRAAARAAQAGGSTPAEAEAAAAAAAPPPLPKGVDAAEEAAKWVLPRQYKQRPAASSNEAGPSRPRVQFEASYLPFVAGEEIEMPNGVTGSGGRRAFGGFGDKPAAEEKEESEAGDSDFSMDEDGEPVAVRARKGVTADKGKRRDDSVEQSRLAPGTARDDRTPEPEDAPKSRTFKRPAGFSPPPTSKPTPKSKPVKSQKPANNKKPGSTRIEASAPGQSAADKMRAAISGMRSVSVGKKRDADETEGGAADSSGAKRPKLAAEAAAKNGTKDSAAPTAKAGAKGKGKGAATPLSLDDRERALKAAKKAEKKKAKKA